MMRLRHECRPGLLTVTVLERALVGRPDWEGVLAARAPDTVLVVLDLSAVEFLSSLFLQGCMDLAAQLAREGQGLALLNVSAYQEQLLELVNGAARLPLLADEAAVQEHLHALGFHRPPGEGPSGVSRAEKFTLWG